MKGLKTDSLPKHYLIILKGIYSNKNSIKEKETINAFNQYLTNKINDQVTLWLNSIKTQDKLVESSHSDEIGLSEIQLQNSIENLKNSHAIMLETNKNLIQLKQKELANLETQLSKLESTQPTNRDSIYLVLKANALYDNIYHITNQIYDIQLKIDSSQINLNHAIEEKKSQHNIYLEQQKIQLIKNKTLSESIKNSLTQVEIVSYFSTESAGVTKSQAFLLLTTLGAILALTLTYIYASVIKRD